MNSLADGLPDEIAQQIHPDWRKNEAAYWAARDQLLARYRDQWIGFADGAVVASGRSPVEVFHAAHRAAQHPFFICVGREEEPCRIRRSSFRYDARTHETQSMVSGLFLATVFADQVDGVIGKLSAGLMQKVDACLKVVLALQ